MKRNIYWDAIKACCIIAVLLIHTTSLSNTVGVVWRQFINYPVSLFFFMAGYFCKNQLNVREFYVKKFCRILVPLFFYSFMYAIPELIRLGVMGSLRLDTTLTALSRFMFDWGYFPIALFQCILLYPLLMRMKETTSIGLSIFLYFLSYAYYVAGIFICPEKITTEYMFPHIFASSWLPMFVLGVIIRHNKASPLLNIRGYWIGVALVISIIEALVWYECFDCRKLAMTQIKPGSILMSIAIALYVSKKITTSTVDNISSSVLNIIIAVGSFSYFIYFSHRFVLKLMAPIFDGSVINIYLIRPVFLIIIMVVVSIVLSRMPAIIKRRLWWIGV